MDLETEVYQILRKHRLPLKKREELIVDLLDFINNREKAVNYTDSSLQLPLEKAEEFFEKGGDWRISCKNLTDGVITKLQWSETEDFEEVYERLNK